MSAAATMGRWSKTYDPRNAGHDEKLIKEPTVHYESECTSFSSVSRLSNTSLAANWELRSTLG